MEEGDPNWSCVRASGDDRRPSGAKVTERAAAIASASLQRLLTLAVSRLDAVER
jgi:hypothetical protein